MGPAFLNQLHPMRLLRWLLILLATLLLLLVGLGLALAVALNSESGRLWLTKQSIEVINRGKSVHIELQGLRSPTLGNWRADLIAVSQDGSPLLAIRQPELLWRPYFLFQHHLLVEKLAATELEVHKPGGESPAPEPAREPLALPFLEQIELQQLQLKTIRLHGFGGLEPNAEQFNLSLDGRAGWRKDQSVNLQLQAASLDATAAQLHLQLDSADWVTFKAEGVLREQAGGSVGQRLKLPLTQAIDARFSAAIRMEATTLTLSVTELLFPLVDNQIAISTDLQYTPEGGDLLVEQLQLGINDTRHRAQGKLVKGQLDFEVEINQLPLSIGRIWLDQLGPGQMSAKLRVGGSIDQPQVNGSASAQALYNDLPLAIAVEGTATARNATLAAITASIAEAEVAGRGSIDWQSRQTKLDFHGRNFELQTLREFSVPLPDNLDFSFAEFSGRLTGAVQDPDVDLKFSGSGHYRQQPFTLNSTIDKRQSTLATKAAHLQLGTAKAVLSGNFDYSSLHADLRLAADALPLQLVGLADLSLPPTLEGVATANLHLQGQIQQPRIEGDASISGRYQDIPFTTAARGVYQASISRVDTLELSIQGQPTLSASLTYAQQQIDLQLDSARLGTDQFSFIHWPLPQGTLQASVNLKGKLDDPQLNASFNYDTQIQGYDEESEPVSLPLQWNMIAAHSDGKLTLDSQFALGNKPAEPLAITLVTKPLLEKLQNPEDVRPYNTLPLAATLAGQLNLQTVAAFIPDNSQSIAGQLSTSLDLSGTLLEPILNGNLNLSSAYYNNFSTGTTIENGRCSVGMSLQKLQLKDCDATDGERGKLILSGAARLPSGSDSGEVNLTLKASQAALLRNPQIESELTGKINLSGDFKALLAKGEVEVSPFTAILSSSLAHQIPTIKVEELETEELDSDEGKPASLQLPVVTLDLVLSARKQAYLRGRGLEAELQGKLKLGGTSSAPTYEGAFSTVRGSFKVFGKKFNLERGQVNFNNNAIGLSIQGVYSKGDRVITANLNGTDEDLKITFSSVPAMPEDEIVSYVIFGKSIQNMSPIEAVQLAAAINTLRGGSGGFDPIDSTRELLGADTLFIETETTEDNTSGVSVGVGKYINERVYLEVERTPNPSQPWKGRVEIELTPNLNLESSTGGKTGIEGAELKWKRSY